MQKRISMPKPKFEIPNIPIKITREGDKIKFVIDKYTLKLTTLPGEKSQTYDFVTLEQFICNVAKIAYQNIINYEQVRKDIESLKDGTTDSPTDNRTKEIA